MSTATVKYLGHLRTENMHLRSGASYMTDAPIDNHGKGEAFSPTDTVAVALANCMLTVMGVKAPGLNVDLTGATAQVTKTMAADPRRISKVEVILKLPEAGDKAQKVLERTAMNCPVLHSLHPEVQKKVDFRWGAY